MAGLGGLLSQIQSGKSLKKVESMKDSSSSSPAASSSALTNPFDSAKSAGSNATSGKSSNVGGGGGLMAELAVSDFVLIIDLKSLKSNLLLLNHSIYSCFLKYSYYINHIVFRAMYFFVLECETKEDICS